MREGVKDLLAGFEPVSLEELDQRAALLRRIDNKYAVPWKSLEELAERLRRDHDVLEISGGRVFSYSTTYFDTPALRCFVDHVEGRIPRFKARTRLYADSHDCVFEVKLKRSDDETDKRQIDYAENDRRHLTADALECVQTALADAGLELEEELSATLTTSFDRITFAARDGSERLTCDLGVTVVGNGGRRAQLRSDLVLVETKSENGKSPADLELNRLEIESISLSKYRVGMSLVGDAQQHGAQPGSDLFE